jgi:hypothetical protein
MQVLEKKLEEFKLDKEALWWYLDLRRYGSGGSTPRSLRNTFSDRSDREQVSLLHMMTLHILSFASL